eukprot:scaffold2950_cov143-Amphora_coffeaeformis.AAC.1
MDLEPSAEATNEGPGKATGVARVGVGVGGEAVLGPGWSVGGKDSFSGADKGLVGRRWSGRRRRRGGGGDKGIGCGHGEGLGEEGVGGGLAEGAHGREVVVDVLGGSGKAAEFMELQGKGGELRVGGNGEGGAALEETVLDGVGERGRPGGNGRWAGGVQGRSVSKEGLKDFGRGVVGGLASLGVKSGGQELAEVMEDGLGG